MKKSNRSSSWFQRALLLSAFLVPSLAQAHPGMSGHSHSFSNGFTHPLSGWDHLCALVAVGLWAAQLGGRRRWLLPMTFVSFMVLGGTLGLGGANIPGVEQGMAASLVVLGIFIATALRLPVMTSVVMVGLFALFHGYAHGAEMPAAASSLSYMAGFAIASASLHLTGLGAGLAAQRFDSTRLVRFAGGGMAMCGLCVFAT